jgi:hypothetical protein
VRVDVLEQAAPGVSAQLAVTEQAGPHGIRSAEHGGPQHVGDLGDGRHPGTVPDRRGRLRPSSTTPARLRTNARLTGRGSVVSRANAGTTAKGQIQPLRLKPEYSPAQIASITSRHSGYPNRQVSSGMCSKFIP